MPTLPRTAIFKEEVGPFYALRVGPSYALSSTSEGSASEPSLARRVSMC